VPLTGTPSALPYAHLASALTILEFHLQSPTVLPMVAQAREVTASIYLDRREASQYMCVSEKFLATHLVDGPKRLRLGAKIVYRLSDIEDWMRQQEVCR
jgi:hypothetical protein